MAENFESINWWNSSSTSNFNSSSPTASSSLSPSTTTLPDVITAAPFTNSSFDLSSSSINWNPPLLSGSGREEGCNFQPFLIETGECSRGTGSFLLTSSSSSSSFFDQSQMSNYQSQMFTSNSPLWNACNSAMKQDFSNLTYTSSEGAKEKKTSSEHAMKKPRIETNLPLPTLKVRKEKLGDRITTLQQLVSPFGKTDTASVLHEAIEYIKFLHDQVNVLSTPYLASGHPVQQQQQQQQRSEKSKDGEIDLSSRGLCLVPIESTYTVASETSADFWTPTFGGTYR